MSRKAVLITGGADRIGAIIAKGLAADGWAVCIHYNRSAEKAQALCEHIISLGGQAVSIGANLSIPRDIDGLIDKSSQHIGLPLTALINNASTFASDKLSTLGHDNFDFHMDVNLRAPIMLSRDFAAHCSDKDMGQSDGVIINMIDQRVLKPNPTYFSYTLAKSALLTATKTMAQALAPNIRVNGIGPGPTLQNVGQDKDMFEQEALHTLLQRSSPPEDILAGIQYLLRARSVTGQMLAIDAGQHLTWKTADIISATPDEAL